MDLEAHLLGLEWRWAGLEAPVVLEEGLEGQDIMDREALEDQVVVAAVLVDLGVLAVVLEALVDRAGGGKIR